MSTTTNPTPGTGRTYRSTVDAPPATLATASTVDTNPAGPGRPARGLGWLGRWLCPAGAGCRRVAIRAGLLGAALTPVEVLAGQALAHTRTGLDTADWTHPGLAGPAMLAVASPLIVAAAAALGRWLGLRREVPAGELLSPADTAAAIAAARDRYAAYQWVLDRHPVPVGQAPAEVHGEH